MAKGGQSAVSISSHLKGLDFPVKKNQIIDNARNLGGQNIDQIIQILQQLPDKEYRSPTEVMEEFGKLR